MELHEKIRYAREYRKISRQELADDLGLSLASIGHMETGTREVKPLILKRIAKFLNVPWEFFMDGDVETLDEFLKKHNVRAILENTEKYGNYLKLVDLALDEGVTEEEFEAFLELRRKIKDEKII